MKLTDGWTDSASHFISPNQDNRPPGISVEALIVHSISLPPGIFGGNGVEQLFTNTLNLGDDPYYLQVHHLKVSSHFFIRRSGELQQFVCTQNRAWHCGASVCLGREAVNDFSIGVELEGLDTMEFDYRQYQTLVELSQCLQQVYPKITNSQIYGHQHIAPDRKTDPGIGFDWYYFLSALQS